MCSLQEHIERDIRARKAEQLLAADPERPTTEDPKGSFSLPKSGRRWRYQGTEKHYGYTYHLWQNELTERKFAWQVEAYRRASTKETA